jgi:hypothetical protein
MQRPETTTEKEELCGSMNIGKISKRLFQRNKN